MASRIITKKGSGAPLASDLVHGELAVDTVNKRLYTENAGGTIIELGTAPSTIDINAGTIDGTVIGGSSAAAGSFTTISASGEIAANGGVAFGDNDKATFGASDDLQIFHTGTESFIREVGEGGLKIDSNGPEITLRVNATENALVAESNGAVTLYYDNAAKLATTATGIDVTGTVTADGLSINGANQLQISNGFSSVVTGSPSAFIYRSNGGGSAPFDVFGNLVLQSRSDALAAIDFVTGITPEHRMRIGGNGDISFYEDTGTTAKFFWDASAESLGIGTTSPSASTSLTAQASASSSLGGILMQDEAGANAGYIFVGGSAHSVPAYRGDLNLYSTNTLNFFTGGSTTQKAIIDSSGNVGIGTTSPSVAVHAVGKVRAQKSGQSNAYIQLSADELTSNYAADIFLNDTGLTFKHNSNGRGFVFDQNGTERMRIDSSGRVGIGTTSPQEELHIAAGIPQIRLEDTADAIGSGNLVATIDGYGTDGRAWRIGRTFGETTLQINNDANSSTVFTTNATEAMRIDSSGNLLVGTTSESTWTTTAGFRTRPSGSTTITRSAAPVLYANRLTSDGAIQEFLKDGTTVGSIGSNAGAHLTIGNADTGLLFNATTDKIHPWNMSTQGVRDGAIDLGVDVSRFKDLYLSGTSYHGTTSGVIWTNTSGEGVVVSNDAIQVARSGDTALLLNRMTTTGKIQVFAQAGTEVGNVTVTASATAYNTSSDYRLKENVVSMDNASDRVLALNPVRFNFIADPEKTVDGFLAHEAQEVVPEAVHGVKDEVDDENNPVYQGIDQSKLVPLLTKALQEALERIAVLESKVGA